MGLGAWNVPRQLWLGGGREAPCWAGVGASSPGHAPRASIPTAPNRLQPPQAPRDSRVPYTPLSRSRMNSSFSSRQMGRLRSNGGQTAVKRRSTAVNGGPSRARMRSQWLWRCIQPRPMQAQSHASLSEIGSKTPNAE
jgi:hypothetical protein